MQFQHPEILYALFLIIIPVLVHLFKLQRYSKVFFTNVQLLKKIELQTRKSRTLKKWLILLLRMLAFACLVIAFSQPYFSDIKENTQFETTLLLDNSYSMQAKGKKGELLKTATKTFIENNLDKGEINLKTNHESFKSLTHSSLKEKLSSVTYSPQKFEVSSLLIPENKKEGVEQRKIIVSDFQENSKLESYDFLKDNDPITLVKLAPEKNENIYIDSVYTSQITASEITFKIILKSVTPLTEKRIISFFKEEELIGKASAVFNDTQKITLDFKIPYAKQFNGKVLIDDPEGLSFDNSFFFSFSQPEKINVFILGTPASFLKNMYTDDEFTTTFAEPSRVDYNAIQYQHLIILNEITVLPNELTSQLKEFVSLGGSLVVIPAAETDLTSYNLLIKNLGIQGKINSKTEVDRKIVSLHYNHPLLADVFEKKVTNFQYPYSKLMYTSQFSGNTPVLSLDNQESFISSVSVASGQFYWIASPLSLPYSNLTNSPLVVPIFYNFARNSLRLPKLYYIIGFENKIEIKAELGKDEVVELSHNQKSIIPLQQALQRKVSLNLDDAINKSGHYAVEKASDTIATIAFNYNREESDLSYQNLALITSKYPTVKLANSVEDAIYTLNNELETNELFRWFLLGALFFLISEVLVLKLLTL